MISTLIFILVLSILVVVHEFGHFVMAKRMGVRVERFAIGFGPKLFGKTIGGTEFAICAFPLGGYVKMAGDERQECRGQSDEYFSKAPGRRALIVLMGPVVNYLMAYVCFCIVFVIGYPALAPKVGKLVNDYPAIHAGIKSGDEILRINEKEIASWEEVQESISTSKGEALNFVVLRNGRTITKTVRPATEVLENIFGQKEHVRLVGIHPQEEIILLRYGFFPSLKIAGTKLLRITALTYKAIYRMATGAMSAKDSLTGPIGIFYIIKQAAAQGISYLLYIMAVISASLAIFNLLPLPILDGGHLFLLGIERVRGAPIPDRVDEILHRIGLTLIICLAAFVFYSDFVRFGWVDKIVSVWQNIGL